MENLDWIDAVPAGLAIAIFLGGILMMFTTIWTTKKTPKN
jgi:succinate-acetate transporter protein